MMKEHQPPSQSWAQFQWIARVLAISFFLAVFIGVIMAWALYLRRYDGTFLSLRKEELHLAQEIYNEITTRTLVDMALMQMEARLNASLILEIATREQQQAAVNASLQEDIYERVTGDALLSARLATEIEERMGNDTLLEIIIANDTTILHAVQAFDVYSSEEFAILEGNVSTVSTAIYVEIAARIAAQAALAAADAIISEDLVLLITQMTAEVAARIAQDTSINTKLHLITTSLLLTIDGQSPIADNMVFESLSGSIVIANGAASNQITLTQTALRTLAGVGPDVTGNLQILGDSGLTVTFPGPNIIAISYSGPVPPSPMNYARLVAVYPFPQSTSEVQAYNGVDLRNGAFLGCLLTSVCVANYGTEWTCQSGFSTSFSGMRCTNTECSDETQCNNILGEPWHCRGGSCVQDYCTWDNDCIDAFGTGQGWTCQNYGCTQGTQNTPYRPDYGSISYPLGSGIYQSIGQPISTPSPRCVGCIFPQAGAYNNNRISYPSTSAYPFVYGNRRPYDPISTYPENNPIYNKQECIFDATWEGENCGFIMPATGTYIVQVTVTVRAAINQPAACYGHLWFYMHIDRSGGSPPNWEQVDSDYMAINNICAGSCPINELYITMTTTLILSTATPSSTFTQPIAPGTFLYAGWSAYADHQSSCSNQYAAWYSITYDITHVA